jgi:hypothetical protein
MPTTGNSILTQEFCDTIAANIDREVPILRFINKTLSDRLEGGSGVQVSALIPNYGIVSKGPSFLTNSATTPTTLGTINALKVQVDKAPVILEVMKVGASYSSLEATLQLFTARSQINEPRLSNLAKTMNQQIFQAVFTGAGSAVIGVMDSEALGQASATIDEGRVSGNIAAMISPSMNNAIVTSPQFKWYDSSLSREHYKGVLGTFQDVEFIKSADAKVGGYFDNDTGEFQGGVGVLRLGTTVPATPAFAITGSVSGGISDGQTTINITGITFGGSTLTKIPVGTPFVIGSGDPTQPGSINSAYTLSSVYSEDTGHNRVFIAMEDAPINAGSATIKVAPIYLNQKNSSGVVTALSMAAVPNTWVTGTPTTDIFTPLLAGVKYTLGVMLSENGAVFASSAMRPSQSGVASTTTQLSSRYNVVNVLNTIAYDGREGQDIWRAECATGISPLYSAGLLALYAQV